ncbi:hypothetical protein MKZ38_002553 [Zalerion maritima]|uniref:Wings apart-like protein C-terminal domain-containing protein n=1 Tax=Zalerion maritima TaxID=339359 RepID=A0AAD5RPT1_9PEZI|nr:hypothetical protein MKZ38_002553 [Zalerion maritima]
MNNLSMASRQGLGTSRKPVATYGKHKTRASASPDDDLAASSSSNLESKSTSLPSVPSRSKLLPVGKPRHQLARRPLSKHSPPLAEHNQEKQKQQQQYQHQDAYSFGSDDDGSKSTKPRFNPGTKLKPAPKFTKQAKSPTDPSRRPTYPPSQSLDPTPTDRQPTVTPPRVIAQPLKPSTYQKQSKIPSNISIPDTLETPRSLKRPPPPPSSPPTTVRRRKRRLIDNLQADKDGEEESSDSSDAESSLSLPSSEERGSDNAPSQEFHSPQPQPNSRREAFRRTPQTKPPGLKFTYSSQRTLLSDTSSLDPGGSQDPLAIFALAAPTNAAIYEEEEDLESSQAGGIRTIHEIRQAGQSSRFTDEMEDILDGVGSSSSRSLRISSLIELVDKLQDRKFCKKFRDFGGDSRLFGSVGKETDIIASTALVCVLLSLLGAGQATHITNKMQSRTLVNMVFPLLQVGDDLQTLARQRSSDLSKNGQKKFVSLGPLMKKPTIWEPMKPQTITPQVLALKCLDLTIEQISDQALEGLVGSPVSDKLFEILSESLEDDEYDVSLPDEAPSPPSHELFLSLTVLKVCSVKAMESKERPKWTTQHLPLVVKALHSSLKRHSGGEGFKTRSQVSQVLLNMTNHNTAAAQVLSSDRVLDPILAKLSDELGRVATSSPDNSFSSDALDNLVLLLGVMVNFCEDNISVRAFAVQSDSLDGIIRPLLVHYQKRSEADSVDKTRFNVAFGYLSVLLGYLCSEAPARTKFKALSNEGTLEPLFVSLREFVALHVALEKEAGTGPGELGQKVGMLVAQIEQDERLRNR